jgi:amino acid adenylation domain-containing protein
MDPASPAARAARILESCENRWILATGRARPLLDDIFSEERFRESIRVGSLDVERFGGEHFAARFSRADLASQSAAQLAYQNTASDAAHILFTSGSTGTPKGVVITHSNVRHFVEWAVEYFGTDPGDRMSGHPPLHFDLSTFDIFGTFAAGGELHLVPPELNLLPNKLAEFIREAELTQWFSVPSALAYMAKFDVVRMGDFPSLKRILWCGEVFPMPALIYWMKRVPHARFTNLYGPTEATIASSYYAVAECPRDEGAAVPIGQPCAGEELLVLGEDLRRLAPGQIGDLYIGGVGLSPGYWRDPAKTQEVFRRNPESEYPGDRIYRTGDLASVGEDGLVYFHGRADTQIKSRGYRIELGEIEAALAALSMLRESAVVATDTGSFTGATICCAYVSSAGGGASPVALRAELSKALPVYMLPTRWMEFDALPKNANGKVDRRGLREKFEEAKHEMA